MKKNIIHFLFATVVLLSCNNISEKDQSYIKGQIALHNSSIGLRMKLQKIDHPEGDAGMTKIDVGYNPQGDADLTYDKLIDYCKKEGIDPVVFAKTLTTE